MSVTDAVVPPTGTFFYYLVSRMNECRESNLGHDSSGTATPINQPCEIAGAE